MSFELGYVEMAPGLLSEREGGAEGQKKSEACILDLCMFCY